jgi:hypothetical protein
VVPTTKSALPPLDGAPVTDSLDLANDILRGAEAIAAFTGDPVERVRYLIRRKLIPHYRQGSRICASKRVLTEHHLAAATGKPEAA